MEKGLEPQEAASLDLIFKQLDCSKDLGDEAHCGFPAREVDGDYHGRKWSLEWTF